MMLLTSKELFEKLKEFEGLRLEAYKDAAGVWTIGYGHTYNVREGDRISEYWAEEMLQKDIETAERQVLALGLFRYRGQDGILRYQGQLDALVSFVFNLGIGRLKESTLLRNIRAGMPREMVAREFRRWHYADGKPLKGLKSRRQWEVERYYENTDNLDEVIEKNKKGRNE
jgi:lysozyme